MVVPHLKILLKKIRQMQEERKFKINKKSLLYIWIIVVIVLGLVFLILSRKKDYISTTGSEYLDIKYPKDWTAEVKDYPQEDKDQSSYEFTSDDGGFTVKVDYEYWHDDAVEAFIANENEFTGGTQIIPSRYDPTAFDTVATINGSDYVVSKTAGVSANDGLFTSGDAIVGISQYVYQVYDYDGENGISPLLSFYADRDSSGNSLIFRYFTVEYTFNTQSAMGEWSSYKSVLSEIISSIKKK